MSADPLERLAQANPVAPGSLAARPAPVTPAAPTRPTRRRRVVGSVVAALGALAIAALVGALIIAAPGDDPATTAAPPVDGALRVSLLERPQAADDVTRPPPLGGGAAAIDPATTRLALDRGPESWFAGRSASDPTSVCIWQTRPSVEVGCYGMSPLERTGVVASRWLPEGLTRPLDALVSEFVGIAPDGIESVTINGETVPVVGNVFAVRITGPPPETLIATGEAAPALPRTAPQVAVATRSGSPPAAALVLAWSGASPEAEPGPRSPRVPRGP
jgi:hypothetical protein